MHLATEVGLGDLIGRLYCRNFFRPVITNFWEAPDALNIAGRAQRFLIRRQNCLGLVCFKRGIAPFARPKTRYNRRISQRRYFSTSRVLRFRLCAAGYVPAPAFFIFFIFRRINSRPSLPRTERKTIPCSRSEGRLR